jgi:hypothetical protein
LHPIFFLCHLKQGITNTLALPIDMMLYIYLLCPHSEHQKKSNSNLNTFTKETDTPCVPMGAGPNKMKVTSPSPGTKLQRFLVGAGDDDIEAAATSSRQAGS